MHFMEKIKRELLAWEQDRDESRKKQIFETKIYLLLFERIGNKVNWKSLYYVHFFQLLLNGFLTVFWLYFPYILRCFFLNALAKEH